MAIIHYTNRPNRAKEPVADRWMAKAQSVLSKGNHDLAVEALDTNLSYPADWQVNSVLLQFSTSQSKTYTVSVQNGRKVVEDENDYLWFITNTSYPTKITLDEGFYTGAELAIELQDKLDTAFSPLTFTVDYNTSFPSLFNIAPSSGSIKYLDVNLQTNFVFKQSIAGHLFGFTEDSVFNTAIRSDTAVPALDSSVPLFSATNTTLLIADTDVNLMDIDQALRLEVTKAGGACEIDWTINYEARV